MRSISQILNLVVDGEITTQDEATKVLDDEIVELAVSAKISAEEARSRLLHNIGYASGYLSRGLAYRVLELYQTEHPYFGKAPWPGNQRIFEMGFEMGEKMRKAERDANPGN